MTVRSAGLMEFHISRQARDRFGFDQALFMQQGNVIFANFHAARVFAQKMNAKRDLVRFPEQAVRAGQVNAMGLIDEILHLVAGLYREQKAPDVFQHALDELYTRLGQEVVDAALLAFVREFPPVAVYQRQISAAEYLEGSRGASTNRAVVLEELLMLWLANANPAFAPFLELFDDRALAKDSAYAQIIPALQDFFAAQPRFGPGNQTLMEMLRSPALAVPYSLPGQLEYIRTNWGALLGRLLYRLFTSLDLIKEEEKAIFIGGGPGPAQVLRYSGTGIEAEPERFSPDQEWMPRLVLIAKNSYVWLDQLSRRYQRPIQRLDQIPDEELDRLAQYGFTGLWLIGLWERSQASKQIKQLRGNPDAVASAYSLYSYEIAADLGGEDAYRDLSRRTWQRGIRLSSDMVPNHMGIDSRWVIEHPDWFVQLDYSPFPSYTFNGPNVSPDSRVGIYIEDHYFDNTDAAVVFKRVDYHTGDTRYIYHGNDGTSMPWNDTAQLNYLMPDVREAVIQTILQVARKFPVIRFDAAMTLAKKHYQRLWFPEPGTGGAIPSRAEFGLTREQFDAAMPEEFWREVVDRVAREVPDTLLLAEAFWLMEGYFVRTLGMHRVYNSAFMNMLRDEKNAEYRLVIKNTLEFDPEILKRYVNFMNNPDERTAVDQFGKGDKYFGICTLMATLPGLPMFGHGQLEGFTERYGMEYRRAYWDEQVDQDLIERHEREIFPLLRRRYLFAGVQDFLLYDFYTPEGHVNEDVFAYSNRAGEARSLVVYHNKYAGARGWVRISAAYAEKRGPERRLVQRTLAEGLGLDPDEDAFTIFRDQVTGLQYLRRNRELFEQGLYVELEAYKFNVFVDFQQMQDNSWRQYAQLESYLNGRGVPSIPEALHEIFLQPIHQPFRELVNGGFFQWLIDNRSQPETPAAVAGAGGAAGRPPTFEQAMDEAQQKLLPLLNEIERLAGGSGQGLPAAEVSAGVRRKLAAALALPALGVPPEHAGALPDYAEALAFLAAGPGVPAGPGDEPPASGLPLPGNRPLADGDHRTWGTLLGWLFIHDLGRVAGPPAGEVSRSWMDEWLLGKLTASALQTLGLEPDAAWQAVTLIKLLAGHGGLGTPGRAQAGQIYPLLRSWLEDSELQRCLNVNRYQDVLWFNREAFHSLVWWMHAASVVTALADDPAEGAARIADRIVGSYRLARRLEAAEARSGYQVEKLLEAAKTQPA